jgi:hypothetical protein
VLTGFEAQLASVTDEPIVQLPSHLAHSFDGKYRFTFFTSHWPVLHLVFGHLPGGTFPCEDNVPYLHSSVIRAAIALIASRALFLTYPPSFDPEGFL